MQGHANTRSLPLPGIHMGKTWELEDVSDRAIDARYTFYLPSREVIDLLSVGDIVKLVFLCDVENDKGWSAERMWVQITAIRDSEFEGFLDNDPYYIPDIKAGDTVVFQPNHIIQTSIDDPVPSIVDDYSSRCFVSGSVLYGDKQVTRLYREEPDEKAESYSGWMLFSVDDSEEFLSDSKNWHYVSLGAVLNKGDEFVELLESDYETGYVWDDSKNEYRKL